MDSLLKYYEERFIYLGLDSEKFKFLLSFILKKHNYCINESTVLDLKSSYNTYINDIISAGTFNYILNEYLVENYNGCNLSETINSFFEEVDYFPDFETSKSILRKSPDLQKLLSLYDYKETEAGPFSILTAAFKSLSVEEMDLVKKSINRTGTLFFERRDIFEKIKSGDIEARNEFFMQNIGLVNSCVLTIPISNDLLDDYRQVGYIALISAINGFDYTRGTKFSTYAFRVIYNAFSRHTAQTSYSFTVPENIHLLIRKYSYLLYSYELEGQKLDDNEACSLLNIDLSVLDLVKKNYHATSLYKKTAQEHYSYLTESTGDGYLSIADFILAPDFIEDVENSLIYDEVRKLIESSNITGKSRACFLDYFGFDNDTGVDISSIPRSSYYYHKNQALRKFCKDNIEKLSNLLVAAPIENVKVYCK